MERGRGHRNSRACWAIGIEKEARNWCSWEGEIIIGFRSIEQDCVYKERLPERGLIRLRARSWRNPFYLLSWVFQPVPISLTDITGLSFSVTSECSSNSNHSLPTDFFQQIRSLSMSSCCRLHFFLTSHEPTKSLLSNPAFSTQKPLLLITFCLSSLLIDQFIL